MRFLEGLDLGTLFFFQHHHLPWLDTASVLISHFGDAKYLLIFVSLVILLFLLRRDWRTALILAIAWSCCWGLNEGVRTYVQRHRPIEGMNPLVSMPTNPSFPSGHAMNGMAIYLGAALVIARRMKRGAALVIVLGAFVGVALGAVRLYFGVHYLTDVVGGWCAGVAFALLITWADRLTVLS